MKANGTSSISRPRNPVGPSPKPTTLRGASDPAGYANPAFWAYWVSGPNLSNLRFCYAQEAIRLEGAYVTATLAHAQLVNCIRGINLVSVVVSSGSSGAGVYLTVNNALLANVGWALTQSYSTGSGSGGSATFNHCTVAQANVLISAAQSFPTSFKNSIFASVASLGSPTPSGSYNGFSSVQTQFGTYQTISNDDPFQTSGGGAFYLKADSEFRAKGTTVGLPATLLTALKSKATQPPIEFPRFMVLSGELTLFPQTPRYVNGPPDLGFWYDALDYTVAKMILDGGNITVQPGTSVGVRNDSYIYYDSQGQPGDGSTSWGFVLLDGSSFNSQGTPQAPNTFTTVELVQDGTPSQYGAPFGKWPWKPCRAELFTIAGFDPEPNLSFRFSNFSVPSQWCYHFITGGNPYRDWMTISWLNTASLGLSLRDCSITGGTIDLGYASWIPDSQPPAQYPGVANLDWQNNLFDRVTMDLNPALDPASPSVAFDFKARNNLFRECALRLIPTPEATIHPYLPGILNLPHLAATLAAQADPVSVYVYGLLSAHTKTLLANYTGGYDQDLQWELALDLSTIIMGPSIYDANRFAGVTLRQETLDLLALNPTGLYLERLNRMLLEDAFPGDLVPISLTLWLFKDNFFDKVAFEQYPGVPLDHDYNGYVLLDETDRLSPAAANDRVLTSAPTYYVGPLGNYYRAPSGPLFQSGSRTAAEAGLAQYTIQPNQTKNNAGSPVSIGLHYVATVSGGSPVPKDTDSDGIPDYVEDANGDGQWDEGLETKINAAYTLADPSTHDSVNAIYDDIDLDGDGMVGRFEKALGTDPLAPDNPLTLAEPTQIQPSVFQFKVLVNHQLGEDIGGLRLNVNGADATLQEGDMAPDGNSLLVWNTLFDSPRQNYLQAQLQSMPSGVEGSVLKAAGPMYPFYSDNVLQFFEAGSLFDESGAYLDADLPEANATYTIQLYNLDTEALIATIGPKSTSNGKIEEDWELNGYVGKGIRAVFNVTLLNAAGVPIQSGSGRRGIAKVSTREVGRNFTWAYFYTPTNETRRTAFDTGGSVWHYMLNVVDVLMMPEWGYEPLFSDFNGYRGGARPDAGYVRSRQEVLDRLRPALKGVEARQAYFHGHGNDGLVGDWHALLGGAYMDAKDVAGWLTNKVNPRGAYELDLKTPYRFVFVDGCSTGWGNKWRQAFGIVRLGAQGEAQRHKLGPQAFVGWSRAVSSLFAGVDPEIDVFCEAYADTLCIFYSDWMHGKALAECIEYASNPSNPGIAMPLPVPENDRTRRRTPWEFYRPGKTYRISGYKSTAEILVSGHPGLTRTGCRHDLDNHYRGF